MNILKKKPYTFFIGIDVSKLTLDLTLKTEEKTYFHQSIGNNVKEINVFLKELKNIKGLSFRNTVFGMEQTGIYCNFLKQTLSKVQANYVIDNPLKVKNSMGLIRGKTDKMDSKRIADYLIKNRSALTLYRARRPIIQQLASLMTLRMRLVGTRTALRNPLKEDQGFIAKDIVNDNILLCSNTISSLNSDIKAVDVKLESIWSSDPELSRKMKLMLSVPSIGPLTAIQILTTTNEFLDINNPKSFACYCGVAPFQYKSGTTISKRTEISPLSNRRMKGLIHNCAIVAITFSPDMRQYYLRKIAEGKGKLSVLNAIRFKLICRVFSCINENRLYQKDYVHKPKIKYQLMNLAEPKQRSIFLRNLSFLN